MIVDEQAAGAGLFATRWDWHVYVSISVDCYRRFANRVVISGGFRFGGDCRNANFDYVLRNGYVKL